MEGKDTDTIKSREDFADDTECQIIQLLQSDSGRKILKDAIKQIRDKRRQSDILSFGN